MTKPGWKTHAVTAFLALVLGGGPAAAQSTFQASADPTAIVIQLSQDVGIRDTDRTPLLRVYGDGRVLVHYPVYMRRAGDYTLQLTPAELNALLTTFVDGGLVEFDRGLVERQMRQVQRSRQEAVRQAGGQPALTTRSDETLISLDVRLDRYTPVAGAARENVVTSIVWAGVQADATEFPELGSLQNLAAVERALRALTERPDLTRVAP